jgi:hypothetical protein
MTLRWRWRTAIHEAGHGVAHVALGGQARQVSTRWAGNTGSRCRLADALPPWERAIVSLAGPCAELFVAHRVTEMHRAVTILGGDPDDKIGGDWRP